MNTNSNKDFVLKGKTKVDKRGVIRIKSKKLFKYFIPDKPLNYFVFKLGKEYYISTSTYSEVK